MVRTAAIQLNTTFLQVLRPASLGDKLYLMESCILSQMCERLCALSVCRVVQFGLAPYRSISSTAEYTVQLKSPAQYYTRWATKSKPPTCGDIFVPNIDRFSKLFQRRIPWKMCNINNAHNKPSPNPKSVVTLPCKVSVASTESTVTAHKAREISVTQDTKRTEISSPMHFPLRSIPLTFRYWCLWCSLRAPRRLPPPSIFWPRLPLNARIQWSANRITGSLWYILNSGKWTVA